MCCTNWLKVKSWFFYAQRKREKKKKRKVKERKREKDKKKKRKKERKRITHIKKQAKKKHKSWKFTCVWPVPSRSVGMSLNASSIAFESMWKMYSFHFHVFKSHTFCFQRIKHKEIKGKKKSKWMFTYRTEKKKCRARWMDGRVHFSNSKGSK